MRGCLAETAVDASAVTLWLTCPPPRLQSPPWPIFRAGRALAARLPLLEARLAPPHAHVLGVAGAFFSSKALHTATKLGVADALRSGPLPVSAAGWARGWEGS